MDLTSRLHSMDWTGGLTLKSILRFLMRFTHLYRVTCITPKSGCLHYNIEGLYTLGTQIRKTFCICLVTSGLFALDHVASRGCRVSTQLQRWVSLEGMIFRSVHQSSPTLQSTTPVRWQIVDSWLDQRPCKLHRKSHDQLVRYHMGLGENRGGRT